MEEPATAIEIRAQSSLNVRRQKFRTPGPNHSPFPNRALSAEGSDSTRHDFGLPSADAR